MKPSIKLPSGAEMPMPRKFIAGEVPRCRIFLDGVEQLFVFACRIGSKGWVKSFTHPIKVSSTGAEVAVRPIKRGNVTYEWCE